jgi:hypothetical protein
VNEQNTVYIGVDAGANCGMAVWSAKEGRFVHIDTHRFWDFIVALGAHCKKYLSEKSRVIIVIEDVVKNRPVFIRTKKDKFGIVRELTEIEMAKIAQNVGENKRDCKLIVEWCERNRLKVIKIAPTKKSDTKINAEEFEAITGHKGRTSSHARDAAMLIWNLLHKKPNGKPAGN